MIDAFDIKECAMAGASEISHCTQLEIINSAALQSHIEEWGITSSLNYITTIQGGYNYDNIPMD